jgi:hypothetical protein
MLSRARLSKMGTVTLPAWYYCLEMAGGDPLKAAQIEEEITEEWWERYFKWRDLKHHLETRK